MVICSAIIHDILTASQPYKRTATIYVQYKALLASGNQSETAFKKTKNREIKLQLGSKCAFIYSLFTRNLP